MHVASVVELGDAQGECAAVGGRRLLLHSEAGRPSWLVEASAGPRLSSARISSLASASALALRAGSTPAALARSSGWEEEGLLALLAAECTMLGPEPQQGGCMQVDTLATADSPEAGLLLMCILLLIVSDDPPCEPSEECPRHDGDV